MTKLTAERLRDLLHYDPETGVFTRRVSTGICGRWRAGNLAGGMNSYGYNHIKIDGHLHTAHRLAWLHVKGKWPACEIDHINGERADNRISNLREATSSQNKQNCPAHKNSWTGVKGVSLAKDRKGVPYWYVQIRVNGKKYARWCHGTLGEAAEIYAELAKKYHGEFAHVE